MARPISAARSGAARSIGPSGTTTCTTRSRIGCARRARENGFDDSGQIFVDLLRRYSDRTQFIVITHQKRTMEVADALYGVSMRGDGVTTVVSQRIRDVAAQSA